MGVKDELTPILRAMEVVAVRRVGPAVLHCGALHGRQVVAVETGIGKVNAAAATQVVIDTYHPSRLLFTGSAGSLSPDLDVGDLVIAEAVALHDMGAQRRDEFVPTGFMVLDEKGRHRYGRRIWAATEMVALARRTAEDLTWENSPDGRPLRVHVGTVVTGDQVILSGDKREWLRDRFGALAVEMEGAAFAQVAAANEVPWLLVRSVSDHADHHFEFAFELWQDYLDDVQTPQARAGRILDRLTYVANDPKALLRARRFLRNLKYAAGNAARLTEAIVKAL